MTFLHELKNQIISQPNKNVCCRRALLNGVVFAKGMLRDGLTVVSLENSEAIEFVSDLIREFFGKSPDISSNKNGGRRKLLSFKSPACLRYLESFNSPGAEPFSEKCQGCLSSFLRGVFLASGRVCNPKKQYRIEFAPIARVDELNLLLADNGFLFSKTSRRAENIIYSANSTTAEDFFAAIGMNTAAFALMNSKIENEFKNTANRIRNCETNNIMKTVSAAARCVRAIEALEEANLLSTLPEELEKTARLRLEYKDYSLARLAAEFTPPISKPGLSHRLNKLVEIAEKLLKDK